ncbi:MAG: type II toxin-antitoxin system RelE/ParE family toxin [Candidatus Omnitrophica bacterium]|nr:type II toxin-antitoxin system RelE/ParE family toxin [Candidatus Omnitrophota bacterium]
MRIKDIIAIKEVLSDLDSGEAFYASQNPEVGVYFRDCIIADIESLWLYAGIHVSCFGVHRMLSTKFPYAIYYEVQNNICIVVAVLDMRRNPAWIQNKLKKRKC